MALFKPKTEKIRNLYSQNTKKVEDLLKLLEGRTVVYIDYANIKSWCTRLEWNIDLKRTKQFFDSFLGIQEVRIYYGILKSNSASREMIKKIQKFGYFLVTKPVKRMKHSIDVTGLNSESDTALLRRFIKRSLLDLCSEKQVKYFNNILSNLNKSGKLYIEDLKCNFDVEMGSDIVVALESDSFDTAIIWTGDSDFENPIKKILKHRKNAILFGAPYLVAKELGDLRCAGLQIFDIKKIKDFISYPRDIKSNRAPISRDPAH